MTYFEFVAMMMESLGPQGEFAAVDYYEEAQFWLVGVAEDIAVSVEIDEVGRQLVISGLIGTLDAANTGSIFKLALNFNHVWYATRGFIMSVDAETDELFIRAAITVDGLSLDELIGIVRGIADQIGVWQQLIRQPAINQQAALDIMSQTGVMRL